MWRKYLVAEDEGWQRLVVCVCVCLLGLCMDGVWTLRVVVVVGVGGGQRITDGSRGHLEHRISNLSLPSLPPRPGYLGPHAIPCHHIPHSSSDLRAARWRASPTNLTNLATYPAFSLGETSFPRPQILLPSPYGVMIYSPPPLPSSIIVVEEWTMHIRGPARVSVGSAAATQVWMSCICLCASRLGGRLAGLLVGECRRGDHHKRGKLPVDRGTRPKKMMWGCNFCLDVPPCNLLLV